jgi:hypothetical protein
VRIIDPNDVMCPNGIFRSVLQGQLLYRDAGHLNDAGSRLVGELLLQRGIGLARPTAN